MITKPMESVVGPDRMETTKLYKSCEEPQGSSARRNLFGCLEDSSALNDLLLRQANEMAERSSALWNFDFATERPLPAGRFVWEPVEVERVPVWYSNEASCLDWGEKENTLTVDACAESKCGASDIKIKCNTTKSRLLQTSIKGYMPVQKRRSPYRLRSKGPHSRFLRPSPRDYILSTAGPSKSS